MSPSVTVTCPKCEFSEEIYIRESWESEGRFSLYNLESTETCLECLKKESK